MAGILKVDRVQSDSNLAFNVASSNVAFMNSTGLTVVGANLSVAGNNVITTGRIVASAMPSGSVIQTVQSIKSDTYSLSSPADTWVDVTGASVTITPTSASSRILVIPDFVWGGDGGLGVNYMIRLFRDSTQIYTPTSSGSRATGLFEIESSVSTAYDYMLFPSMRMFLDSPATTSAVTYKIQARLTNGGTFYLNRNHVDTDSVQQMRTSSSFTVMEIAG
jgi:hypothetical protein